MLQESFLIYGPWPTVLTVLEIVGKVASATSHASQFTSVAETPFFLCVSAVINNPLCNSKLPSITNNLNFYESRLFY